jgi:hypothetical protein
MKFSIQRIASQTALLSGVFLSGLPHADGHCTQAQTDEQNKH